MTDDFDKVDEDFADEFDFIEDDDLKSAPQSGGSSSTSSAPVNKPGPGSAGLIRMISIGAVVIGSAYFGYVFLHSKAAKEAADTAAATPTTTDTTNSTATPTTLDTPVNNAEAAPVDFNQPVSDTTMPIAEPTTKDKLAEALPDSKSFTQIQKDLQKPTDTKAVIPDEINATLDSISEEMTLNVNQIKQLETTITGLASTLEQLNKSISAMDNRVLGLTETVDGLAQDLNNVKKIMTDEDVDLTSTSSVRLSNKSKPSTLKDSAPDYSVHAIIPGRAWLKSASGQIITVTEGDKVGDYGTIAVIDAANGLVRTSSGITFR